MLGSILVDLLRINGDEHCNDMCRVHCHFVISSDTADPVGLAWKAKKKSLLRSYRMASIQSKELIWVNIFYDYQENIF